MEGFDISRSGSTCENLGKRIEENAPVDGTSCTCHAQSRVRNVLRWRYPALLLDTSLVAARVD